MQFEDYTQKDLRKLVQEKLDKYPGSFTYSKYLLPLKPAFFESGKHEFIQKIGKQDSDPEAIREGLTIFNHSSGKYYYSSLQWRECLRAQDNPSTWISFARFNEIKSQFIESTIAITAAKWLAGNSTEITNFEKERTYFEAYPQRIYSINDEFKDLPFQKRHWNAWYHKETSINLNLPTLMVNESDENFSIRARIYRSLGQCLHPASIQILHEACTDPHPFARAQAVRSLGWIKDPTFIDELKRMSLHDPETEIRRVAKKALQRIIGFWLFYGEWLALSKSPEKHLETLALLKERNMGCFAQELIESFRDPETGYVLERKGNADIAEELEQYKLSSEWDSWGGKGSYRYYFKEALEFEEKMAKKPSPKILRMLMQSETSSDTRTALYYISKYRLKEHADFVSDKLESSSKSIAWNARRTFRKIDFGRLDQRRKYKSCWKAAGE